ncbi:MAG: hypothetical protein K0S80_3562 [Neobacillus sp.]|nr:hypothetical protein [Neobacillus sp.]
MYDKEEIYDNKISPLMKQIIEICKREEIPMAASFFIKEELQDEEFYEGQPMYCSTVLAFKGKTEGHDQIKFLSEAIKYGRKGKPFVAAFTVRHG